MKPGYVLLLLFVLSVYMPAQNSTSDSLLSLGLNMYYLERASWQASDYMIDSKMFAPDRIGGYVSYPDSNGSVRTIFYTRAELPTVLLTVQFNKSADSVENINIEERQATVLERKLMRLRQDAKLRVMQNADSSFQFYKDIRYNFIPMQTPAGLKVYIILGPKTEDFIPIGGDFILHYDDNGEYKGKDKLHNSVLLFRTAKPDDSIHVTTGIHSHVLNDYITETDIFTLFLYNYGLQNDDHVVMGQNYVSLLKLKEKQLLILKREIWEKIYNKK